MRNTRPLTLVVLNAFPLVGQSRLVRVLLPGKVSFTLVVDGSGVSGAALNGAGVGELDVWRTPDDTLDS